MNRNLGMHVETERLVLRRPTLADVPALFEFLGDATAMQCTHVDASVRECRRRIAAHERRSRRDGYFHGSQQPQTGRGSFRHGTVAPPRRRPNAELRSREHLTEAGIERLIKAAGDNRHGHRDATMLLVAYRHGLRAAELVTLKWDQVDLVRGCLHVNRVKNGWPSVHQLAGVELRALRRLKRESPQSPFVFVSERGVPFTTAGFRKMIARLGEAARFKFGVHPHMLRHACGYKLGNDGVDTRSLQAYMGHKNIQHTVRYTELSPDRFKGFWKD